jgi:hypothetical protein
MDQEPNKSTPSLEPQTALSQDLTSSKEQTQESQNNQLQPDTHDILNSSIFIADLDLSKLDARRQAELNAVLEDKEKLIIEKSKQHKEILKDFQSLKEQFLIKDTEVERLKKALNDQKGEFVDYREKMRLQHEEIVTRLRMAEDAVKDISSFATSLSRLVTGVQQLALKSFNEVSKGEQVDLAKDPFEVYMKDIDKTMKEIVEKIKKNPKKILGYLNEAKMAGGYVKDKLQIKLWQEGIDSLSKFKEDEKREKLSIRRESIKKSMAESEPGTPNLTTMSRNNQPVQFDTNNISKLAPESKNIIEQIVRMMGQLKDSISSPETPDKKVFTQVAKFITDSSNYISSNLPKYYPQPDSVSNQLSPDQSSPQAAPATDASPTSQQQPQKVEIPQELVPKLTALAEKLATFRQQFESQVQSDNNALNFDLGQYIEEATGVDDQLYELLRANQELKEKVASERLRLETTQSYLGKVSSETLTLKSTITELQSCVSQASNLLQEETAEFLDLSGQESKLRLTIDVLNKEIERIKQWKVDRQEELLRTAEEESKQRAIKEKMIAEVIPLTPNKQIAQSAIKGRQMDQNTNEQPSPLTGLRISSQPTEKPENADNIPEVSVRLEYENPTAEKDTSRISNLSQNPLQESQQKDDIPLNNIIDVSPNRQEAYKNIPLPQEIKTSAVDDKPNKTPTTIEVSSTEAQVQLPFSIGSPPLPTTPKVPQTTFPQNEPSNSQQPITAATPQQPNQVPSTLPQPSVSPISTRPVQDTPSQQATPIQTATTAIAAQDSALATQQQPAQGTSLNNSTTLPASESLLSSLLSTVVSLHLESATGIKLSQDLTNLDALLESTKQSLAQLKKNNEAQNFELNRKHQLLSAMQGEESKTKEAYVLAELKLELAQQKIHQVQADINKLQARVEEVNKETEGKKKDVLVKEKLVTKLQNKVDNKMEMEMVEIKKVDEEAIERNKAAQYNTKNTDEKAKRLLNGYDNPAETVIERQIDPVAYPQDISYIKVAIACAVPMVIMYLLYKFHIL